MGNENSSMCTCYDNEAERLHAESNIYKNRLPTRGNGSRFANKVPADTSSQYSVKAGVRTANSVSPHSSTFRNQNTYTSTKKSNMHMGGMHDNGGSMTSRYDSRALAMTQVQSSNGYGRPIPQGQYMDEDLAWQYNTPNSNAMEFNNPAQQQQYASGSQQRPLQKFNTDKADRRPVKGKYNNFMDDSQQMGGPPQNHGPYDNGPYPGNGKNGGHYDQQAYPAIGYEVERSSRSGRSGHGGNPPQLKSRPRQPFSNSPQESQRGYYNPKKFKEEDSFAAMQGASLRQDDNRRRNSRARGSRSNSFARNKDSTANKKETKSRRKDSTSGYNQGEQMPLPANHQQMNGYSSGNGNNSYTSGKKGNPGSKSNGKKPLHMGDFKKFKKLKNIDDRYLFGKTLGQGAFGTVKLCMHKDSQKTFAIKIMHKAAIKKQHIYIELLQNELQILGEKSHPNIIRIVDLIEDNENYYIVSEVVKGGELFNRLTKLNSFTESQAADIISQIMLGLNYMHLQSITHRDLKPENILLVKDDDDCFDIKIADLGFAQKFDKEKGLDLVLGTPLYMAPELVKHERYTEKVDVWSLGVIVFQLLCGKTPYDAKNLNRINQNICNKEISFTSRSWSHISENAKHFIRQCLNKDQYKRPSISELFDHPWICEIPEVGSNDEEAQLNIQGNLVQYQKCSDFQKIVLSLLSGLSASQEELEIIQKEFVRIDKDRNGTLSKWELEQMVHQQIMSSYDVDWDEIIDQCDYNNDGVIDFQEFMSATIDRKVLTSDDDLKCAFRIMDTNGDGHISLDDFDDLFNSYGGARMDQDLWETLLMEADKNGDGIVTFEEFQKAMGNILRKTLKKKKSTGPSHK